MNTKKLTTILIAIAAFFVALLSSVGSMTHASESGNTVYFFAGIANILSWTALAVYIHVKRDKSTNSKIIKP